MIRKYIKRNNSGWNTENGSKHVLGAKINIEDSIDAQDRNIAFTKYERPLTPTEATHVMVKELTSTIQDTGQYLQDVKTHMDRQMSTINKIKAQKREFDKELEMLQFGNPQPKTNSSVDEMNKIRNELVEKKKLEETNLVRLSKHVMVTKRQVDQYQALIDEVDDKLRKIGPHQSQ